MCPELYISGYNVGDKLRQRAQKLDGEHQARVAEIAMLHNISIVYTYPESYGESLYNSAGLISNDRKLLGHHRKNHIPGGFEREYFTRDHGIAVLSFAVGRLQF